MPIMNTLHDIPTVLTLGLLMGAAMVSFAGEQPAKVVMFGDSTTKSAYSGPKAKITELVQAYLTQTQHLQVVVVNAGSGGDTVKGGYARLQNAVLDHNPDVVTISFGLNDAGKLTPDEFGEWLEKIILAIQQKSRAKILLVTSTPFNNARHGWGKEKRFISQGGLDEYMDANICARMRDLARKYQLPLCDVHACFREKIDKDPELINVLIRPDGVHPTDAGNRVAAGYLAPMIASLLTQPAVPAAEP